MANKNAINNGVQITYNYTPDPDSPDIVYKDCEASNISTIITGINDTPDISIKKFSCADYVSPEIGRAHV